MTKSDYKLWQRANRNHTTPPLRRVLLARQALSAAEVQQPWCEELDLLEDV